MFVFFGNLEFVKSHIFVEMFQLNGNNIQLKYHKHRTEWQYFGWYASVAFSNVRSTHNVQMIQHIKIRKPHIQSAHSVAIIEF